MYGGKGMNLKNQKNIIKDGERSIRLSEYIVASGAGDLDKGQYLLTI